jgi:hypothetical protein
MKTSLEFQGAIWSAIENDKGPLSTLLRSNYPLSPYEKGVLADLNDGKFRRPRGRTPWRATDEIALKTGRAQAAVRRAAFYIGKAKKIAQAEKRSRAGIHKWAIEQAILYMTKRGFHLPNCDSLENYLRRSKKRTTKAQR